MSEERKRKSSTPGVTNSTSTSSSVRAGDVSPPPKRSKREKVESPPKTEDVHMASSSQGETDADSARGSPSPTHKVSEESKPEAKELETKSETKKSAFNHEDLQCVVCKEFPQGPIYQCRNGHFLCTGCRTRVVESEKSSCPSCRVKLSRDHPSRNRFAENILATVEVDCTNEGCSQKVSFGTLKEHVEQTCPFRPASCKYSKLGCEWTGIVRDSEKHEESCPLKGKKAKQILKLICDKEAKRKAEDAKSNQIAESNAKIVKLLSSRARDIVLRDVVLEKDDICNEVCSKTFMALGYAWEVILTKEKTSKKPALNIRMVSFLRRKLQLTFFVLPGPYVDMKLPPCIFPAEFKKRKSHQNNVFVLPVSEDLAKQLSEVDSLHLRIGFVDRSHGVSRWFTNQDQRHGDNSDDSSSSDSDDGRDDSHYDRDDSDEDDSGDQILEFDDSGDEDDEDYQSVDGQFIEQYL